MSDKVHKLTERQKRFVEAYAASGNATQSARDAGYRGDPETIGPRLLGNVGVALALRAEEAKRTQTAILTREQRQKLLTEIALGQAKDVDTGHRLKAIELLGKMNGDFASVGIVMPHGQDATVAAAQPEGDGGPVVVLYMPHNGRDAPR